jgi:ATP-dependent Clp protease ATP-binding subunit ClpC
MFERFTDRARKVVVLAQDEARELGHAEIRTEHLLLGILDEGHGVANRMLESAGIGAERLRARLLEGPGVQPREAEPGAKSGAADIADAGASEGSRRVVPPVATQPSPKSRSVGERIREARARHIPFTREAKKVLELSLREALDLGHNYIGTEHIMLGLMAEGEGVAAQVLRELGADMQAMRASASEILRSHPAGSRSVVTGIGRAHYRWEGEVLAALEAISDRLTAIERHLGIARPHAQDPGDQPDKPEPQAPSGT